MDRTEKMVACSLAIALSFVLHFLRVYEHPTGGSITLGSMVPIWVVARRYGLASGVMAGTGFGLLLLVQGKVVHPLQAVLDYPVAYGALGLAALSPRAELGASISCLVRYACHVTSGVVFYAANAPAALDPTFFSLLHNLFMVPDMAVALGILQVLRARAPHLLGEAPRAKDEKSRVPAASLVFMLAGLVVFGWAVLKIRAHLP